MIRFSNTIAWSWEQGIYISETSNKWSERKFCKVVNFCRLWKYCWILQPFRVIPPSMRNYVWSDGAKMRYPRIPIFMPLEILFFPAFKWMESLKQSGFPRPQSLLIILLPVEISAVYYFCASFLAHFLISFSNDTSSDQRACSSYKIKSVERTRGVGV